MVATRYQLRRLRRSAVGIVCALLVLAGVIAGSSGRDAQFCVCTAGITIEHPGEPCCGEDEDGGGPDHARILVPCTDCHLIPLPDGTAVANQAQGLPVVALSVPARIPVATIAWPAAASAPPRLDQWHPPPQRHLRLLRTVVITC